MSANHLVPPVGEHDHSLGHTGASLILVEYGDYECPHCAAAQPIVQRVRERLGDRLRFVFRNFPLAELHPHAQHAAEAAESVAEHGGDEAFWAMHDLIFEHQWDLRDSVLGDLAEQAGGDARILLRDLEQGRHRLRVRADFMSGVRSGVNGTPTFFINGRRHDGPWDEMSLVRALEWTLSQTSLGRLAGLQLPTDGPWQ